VGTIGLGVFFVLMVGFQSHAQQALDEGHRVIQVLMVGFQSHATHSTPMTSVFW
jgi:hypothetical protein